MTPSGNDPSGPGQYGMGTPGEEERKKLDEAMNEKADKTMTDHERKMSDAITFSADRRNWARPKGLTPRSLSGKEGTDMDKAKKYRDSHEGAVVGDEIARGIHLNLNDPAHQPEILGIFRRKEVLPFIVRTLDLIKDQGQRQEFEGYYHLIRECVVKRFDLTGYDYHSKQSIADFKDEAKYPARQKYVELVHKYATNEHLMDVLNQINRSMDFSP